MRFFIYNCFGDIVGNPEGYKTIKGARAQADSVKTKTGKAIRYAHDAHIDAQEKRGLVGWKIDRTLYSIK